MVHYDGSRTDEGAAEWFRDPRGRFGYTWLVLDDARVVELATREAGMSDQVASARWGRLGRKQDPTGLRGDKRRIVDMTHVRTEVRQALELARSIGRRDHVRLAA